METVLCDRLCGAMLAAWKLVRLDRNGILEDVTQEVESVHFKALYSHLREETAADDDDDDDDDDDHAVRY